MRVETPTSTPKRRGCLSLLWRFMVVFSFVVNMILVVVLLGLLLFIFDIKNNIASPLVKGLHSSFVGLNDSTIDWTIPVRTTIPLNTSIPLNTTIPLNTDTIVTLTGPVPLNVNAIISLNGNSVATNVSLTLPQGLELPVHLNLDVPVNLSVPVNLEVPVALDVRAVIPLSETQLHDPVDNLRLLFEPIVRALDNLPNNFGEVPGFIGNVLSGNVNLLSATPYSQNPWPGYSLTAGVNYDMGNVSYPPSNVPIITGIVPVGGIPSLDEPLRPELYDGDNTPATYNAQAVQAAIGQGVPVGSFDGSYGSTIYTPADQARGEVAPAQPIPAQPPVAATPIPAGSPDQGIIPATPGG